MTFDFLNWIIIIIKYTLHSNCYAEDTSTKLQTQNWSNLFCYVIVLGREGGELSSTFVRVLCWLLRGYPFFFSPLPSRTAIYSSKKKSNVSGCYWSFVFIIFWFMTYYSIYYYWLMSSQFQLFSGKHRDIFICSFGKTHLCFKIMRWYRSSLCFSFLSSVSLYDVQGITFRLAKNLRLPSYETNGSVWMPVLILRIIHRQHTLIH